MPSFKNLDPTDLVILRAIVERPEIRTREVEQKVYLSRTQVLRRLQRLEKQGLIVRTSEKPKASYTYTLDKEVTSEEIERFSSYWEANRDPIAREALKILVQGLEIFSDQLAEFSDQLAGLASRIENILK